MYKYKVTFWDVVNTQEATDEGVVNASDYGAASLRLVKYYGADCIIDIYLYEIDSDEAVITLEEIKDTFNIK